MYRIGVRRMGKVVLGTFNARKVVLWWVKKVSEKSWHDWLNFLHGVPPHLCATSLL
jgi:hypothetical protein